MSDAPYIYFIGVTVLILFLGAVIERQYKKASLKSAAAELGTNVIVTAGITSGFEIQFERDNTVFRVSIGGGKSAVLNLNFQLPPQFDEKFYIRQNSIRADFRAWQNEDRFSSAVSIPQLSDNYIVLSSNPSFIRKLLSNQAVLKEINSFNWLYTTFQLQFEDGRFQIELISGSSYRLGEKFHRICHAGFVFHDSLNR